jgi:hypothetical protein
MGSDREQLPDVAVDDGIGAKRMGAVVSGVLFLAAVALAAQFGLRVLIRYALEEGQLRVRFAGMTVVRVPYEQIDDVGTARFWDLLVPRTGATFNGIRAGNRIFFREAVVVKRASGVRKFIILTPDVPSAFAADLKTRASRAKQMSGDVRQ